MVCSDLDSLCCAVLYAYLRTQSPPHYKLHIPISNIPREDLSLRPELSAVLKYAGVKTDELLTLSDLEEAGDSIDPQDTRWMLVDHNALTGPLEKYGSHVAGCVDHHVDEGRVPQDTGDEPRILEKTGSCMSLLLTEKFMPTWKELSSGDDGLAAQLAHVALGPMLIDTTNLQDEDKTTSTDKEAVTFAESLIGKGSDYDRTKFFEEISRLKKDVSQFSYRDLFRKDYKQWTEGGLVLGTSSVSQGIPYMLEHNGDDKMLLSELRKWAEERKLDIASIMTASSEEGGIFRRGLLVWALNENAVHALQKFVDKHLHELELGTFQDGKLDGSQGKQELRFCWNQKAVKNSRKQLAPMLRSAMKDSSRL